MFSLAGEADASGYPAHLACADHPGHSLAVAVAVAVNQGLDCQVSTVEGQLRYGMYIQPPDARASTMPRRTGPGWTGLDWISSCLYIQNVCLPCAPKITYFFLTTLPTALAFSHVLVGPRTLTRWESCMQVRASSHTAVCHKQGSPVHDLHHAHRVQSIPCNKTAPFASFARPGSAWAALGI